MSTSINDDLFPSSNEQLGVTSVALSEQENRYYFAVRYSNGKKVLDLGCGLGFGSHILRRNAEVVFGIDISESSISFSSNSYSDSNLFFLLGDGSNLPFPDNYFDMITCFEVIEHIDDHDNFLNECKRVLNSKGLFLCSTPNKRFHSGYWNKPLNPFHNQEFNMEDFYKLISSNFHVRSFHGQSVMSTSSRFKCEFYLLALKLLNLSGIIYNHYNKERGHSFWVLSYKSNPIINLIFKLADNVLNIKQEKPKLNGDHHIKGDSVEVTPLSSSNTKYVVSVAQKL